jgi:AGCS family alanine or glycine:cation symporter
MAKLIFAPVLLISTLSFLLPLPCMGDETSATGGEAVSKVVGAKPEMGLDQLIDEAMKGPTGLINKVIFWTVRAGGKVGNDITYDRGKGVLLLDDGDDDPGTNREVGTNVEQGEGIILHEGKGVYRLEKDPAHDRYLLTGEGRTLEFYPSKGIYVYTDGIDIPFVLVWLLVGALVFTVYFKFVNLRCFGLAIDIVRGKYTDPEEKGEVSHFQALTAALSGTVGLGNIAGVAVAISLGGPGATFWMIVAGLLGMSSKFAECTLGVKYRKVDVSGKTYGGPMYYLAEGFAKRGWAGFGKFIAIFFAVMCIGGSLGGGNMYQINQAYKQFVGVTGGEVSWWYGKGAVFGFIIAVVVALVIIGGIRSIARVTARIVPFMCGIYVLAAFVVLFKHFGKIPDAIVQILCGAFSPQAIAGGMVGVMIQGFKRAAFSNEAGIGSSSIAHSAVRTNNPASEGLVSLLEPFIDTVVVCTMTALVIIITGQGGATSTSEGVTITSAAFASVISWFPVILTVAVILFAFSTMIAWSYYGEQSWVYLFGRSKGSRLSYKLLFCTFIVIGAAMTFGNVIDFSDSMIFAMCFPNLVGLYFMLPEVKEELDSYLTKIEEGEIKRRP